MKKLLSRFLPLLFACMIACMPVFAEETGSISVDIKAYAGDEAVSGGSLNLYQIAKVDGYDFIYLEDFDGLDAELLTQEGLEKADTAETFEEYIKERDIQAIQVQAVDAKGHTVFEDVPEGLYLITQETAAEGYTAINAFLVTVPFTEDGITTYNVDASPKVAPVEKIENPQTPNPEEPEPEEPNPEEPEPENPETPSTTEEPKDEGTPEVIDTNTETVSGEGPKTGDVMSIAGIILMILAIGGGTGLVIYRRRCAS